MSVTLDIIVSSHIIESSDFVFRQSLSMALHALPCVVAHQNVACQMSLSMAPYVLPCVVAHQNVACQMLAVLVSVAVILVYSIN